MGRCVRVGRGMCEGGEGGCVRLRRGTIMMDMYWRFECQVVIFRDLWSRGA